MPREEEKAQRTAMFTPALQNVKILAEGGTLPPPSANGDGCLSGYSFGSALFANSLFPSGFFSSARFATSLIVFI